MNGLERGSRSQAVKIEGRISAFASSARDDREFEKFVAFRRRRDPLRMAACLESWSAGSRLSQTRSTRAWPASDINSSWKDLEWWRTPLGNFSSMSIDRAKVQSFDRRFIHLVCDAFSPRIGASAER